MLLILGHHFLTECWKAIIKITDQTFLFFLCYVMLWFPVALSASVTWQSARVYFIRCSMTMKLKRGLYRFQILCRRHPFWSYPAGLTIAEVSPSLFTPLSPSLFTPHQILYSASLNSSNLSVQPPQEENTAMLTDVLLVFGLVRGSSRIVIIFTSVHSVCWEGV